jgi:UDP-2-acetamido-3-amino-2,3-dideoxy-glucuronate N-acetyltransferase
LSGSTSLDCDSLKDVARAQTVSLKSTADTRGLLTAMQYPEDLPFIPVRAFIVNQSPRDTVRGGHAHRTCHQFLVAVHGSINVEFEDDNGSSSISLSDSSLGLYIPPFVWAQQCYVTEGASLVVLASHPYEAADYIDDRNLARDLRYTESH